MVKIFSVEQIREADQYTIEHEPISSLDLMERAAGRAADWVKKQYPSKETCFATFCGIGNNGGDGLVISRLLQTEGYQVDTYIVELSKNYSPDLKKNLERLDDKPQILREGQADFQLKESAVIIDAIFGTGLSRKAEGVALEVIRAINQLNQEVIAIDIPSGLYAENNPAEKDWPAVQSKHTLTFQFPKLAMLFPQNASFVGDWHLIDIGLHPDYIQKTKTKYFFFTALDAKAILKSRKSFAHKGDHGRALILAGSKGKMGAAVLAGRACLRAGAGLLTFQSPRIGYDVLQTTLPEAMVECDEHQDHLGELKTNLSFSAMGIGPGIGMHEDTAKLLKLIIQQTATPLVLDADALNILAENKTWLSFLPKTSILSPHPGEFKRLVGEWENDSDRLNKQIGFSTKYGVYLLLKGKFTSISTPDGKVYFNSSGNPGMASGGSGDALTGILTSFLAQAYSPEQSALLAAFIHGLAGDLAAEKQGEISMLPSDLIEALGAAFKSLQYLD